MLQGGSYLGNQDGAARILCILRNYVAPEAADAIRRQAMLLSHARRADQRIDAFIVEFDLLGRNAESNMGMGAGFPGPSISILLVNTAGLPRQKKPPALAGCRRSLKSGEVAANMRRSFGSRGGSRR